MKVILLARSCIDNILLSNILSVKGYKCINLNIIKYINIDFDYSILQHVENIIITSKYAANLLKVNNNNYTVLVVGNKSAQILLKKRYLVKFIANNALELKHYIESQSNIVGVYLSSNYITVKMPITISRYIFYKVMYKDNLTIEEIIQIKEGIDYILLYSLNSSKTFITLILRNKLLYYIKSSTILTISNKVYNSIISTYCKNTIIFNNTDEIIKYLDKNY